MQTWASVKACLIQTWASDVLPPDSRAGTHGAPCAASHVSTRDSRVERRAELVLEYVSALSRARRKLMISGSQMFYGFVTVV